MATRHRQTAVFFVDSDSSLTTTESPLVECLCLYSKREAMKFILFACVAAGTVAAIGLYGLEELPVQRLLVILISVMGVAGSVFVMSVRRTKHDDWLRALSEFADRQESRSRRPVSNDVLANSSVCL